MWRYRIFIFDCEDSVVLLAAESGNLPPSSPPSSPDSSPDNSQSKLLAIGCSFGGLFTGSLCVIGFRYYRQRIRGPSRYQYHHGNYEGFY